MEYHGDWDTIQLRKTSAFALEEDMKQGPSVRHLRKTDLERIAEVDLDALSEAQLRELYDEIFGEPSDAEIAQALREAEAEFEAVGYSQPDESTEDDEPYREPTRQEILEGIKEGYMQARAGIGRPIQELLDELED